jgi:hypothetical protein
VSNATEPVPCYGDSILPAGHLLRLDAERVYREAYLCGAREASQWLRPDIEVIEFVEEQRQIARENARIERDGAEWYIPGHEVLAAQLRGRHHALSFVEQAWSRPEAEGRNFTVEMDHWLTLAERWAAKPIDFSEPPRPDDDWDAKVKSVARPCPANPSTTTTPGNLEWLRTGTKPVLTEAKQPEPDEFPVQSLRELVMRYPHMRPPVVHGLLREGETLNVIASPKVGKSWLVSDLALAVATGRPWLDLFSCEQGRVLLIDNELHKETSASRIPKVMEARGITLADCDDRIDVVNLRGKLKDIFGLGPCFARIEPGRYKLVVIDAFYRAMPRDTDENDNGTMAQVYNVLDAYAAKLRCAFVLIHHSTKGNQSGKAITDVGAGAGAQSRAADTHLVLRPHEEPGVAVLDAAVRSWPPIEPRCLRWSWPVWTVEESLDPADLKSEKPRRKPKPAPQPEPTKVEWDAERFTAAFVSDQPATRLAIEQAATKVIGSERQVNKLLKLAEQQGLIHRWKFAANQPSLYATKPQPKPAGQGEEG